MSQEVSRFSRIEMVERAAKALAFLNCSDEVEAARCWPNYCDDARAVIRVLANLEGLRSSAKLIHRFGSGNIDIATAALLLELLPEEKEEIK